MNISPGVRSRHVKPDHAAPLLSVVHPSVLMALLLLLGASGEEAHRTTLESGQPTAASLRQYTIWPTPTSAPRWYYYIVMGEGVAVMRRFQSPGRARLVRGAVYVIASDVPERDVAVSVSTDDNGECVRTGRISFTRVTVRAPVVAARTPIRQVFAGRRDVRERASRVEFSMQSPLEAGHYYWLVLEPTWLDKGDPDSEFATSPREYNQYLALLVGDHGTKDTVIMRKEPHVLCDESMLFGSASAWSETRWTSNVVTELQLVDTTAD